MKMIISEEVALEHIDQAIRFWRSERLKESKIKDIPEGETKAACYVDAWQSARTSLFGYLLPPED